MKLFVRTALLLGMVTAVSAHAERILIPVLYNGLGANGSRWFSSLEAVNNSSDSWRPPHVGFLVSTSCAIPEGCFYDELRPGQHGYLAQRFGFPPGVFFSAPGGLILYTPPADQDISVAAFLSSGPEWGTELPRVRERDFHVGSILLVRVPLHSPAVRSTLRVYALDAASLSVTVLIRDRFEPQRPPLASTSLNLSPSGTNDPADSTPLYPAYAQSSLDEMFPSLDFRGAASVSLEIQAPEEVKFWAFLSVVDNATNHVTLITP